MPHEHAGTGSHSSGRIRPRLCSRCALGQNGTPAREEASTDSPRKVSASSGEATDERLRPSEERDTVTFLGVLLIVLGLRSTLDNDNEVYQTVSGIIVTLIGAILVIIGSTTWLDRIFF